MLGLTIFSACGAELFQEPKSKMVLEIEKFMEEYQEEIGEGSKYVPTICRADDFAHIVKKYIPEKATREDIMKMLRKNGFDVALWSGSKRKEYRHKQDIGVIAAERYYEKKLLFSRKYIALIYIDSNNNILEINTNASCSEIIGIPSEIVLEIEKYIEDHPKGPCRADDFVHIIEKYIPEKATRQDIMKILEESGFDVEFKSRTIYHKYRNNPKVGVIIAHRYYQKDILGSKDYVILVYINKNNNNILEINTGVGCGLISLGFKFYRSLNYA